MTVEEDLRTIYSAGSAPDPLTESKEAIGRLADFVNAQQDYGPLLGTLLNEEWGLIKSIRLYHRRDKWAIARQLLRSLFMILDHAGSPLDSYTQQFLTLCDDLDSEQEAVLVGGEIFMKLIEHVPLSVRSNNVIWKFFQRYLRYLTLWDNSYLRLNYVKFFDLMGLMVHKLSRELRKISPAFKQLWDVLVIKLPVEQLDSNPSGKLLLELKSYYTPSEEQRRTLYQFFESNLEGYEASSSSRNHSALLRYFPKFMGLFEEQLMMEYERWHNYYLAFASAHPRVNWDTEGSSDSEHPLVEFYQKIFSLSIMPRPALARYFAEHLIGGLLNNRLLEYDAVCLVTWSHVAQRVLRVSNLDRFLNKLTKYLLSSFKPGIDLGIYVACIECAFVLMRNNPTLFVKYGNILAGIIVNLTAGYNSSPDIVHNLQVVHSLRVCSMSVTSDVNLKRIIFLTILKMSAKNTSYDAEFWLKFFGGNLGRTTQLYSLEEYWAQPDIDYMKYTVSCGILEAILLLCTYLNLRVYERELTKDDGCSYSQMVVDSPSDEALFTKCVQVFGYVVDALSANAYREWVPTLLRKAVKLFIANSSSIPMAKLISVILRGNSHNIDPKVMDTLKLELGEKFIANCFVHSQELYDERQKAYMEIVMNLPCSVLANHLKELTPFLKTTFLVARRDPRLAKNAIRTFKKWARHFGQEVLHNTIVDVMPHLCSLTALATDRRNVNKLGRDDEVQEELYLFLGVLQPGLLEKYYLSLRPEMVRGNGLLELNLGGLPYHFNLNSLLPDVLLLACQASDPETRRRSCELLGVLTRYIIGTCARVDGTDKELLMGTFKVVLIRVFEVAVDDSHPEVKRICSTLMLQCVNLFSCTVPGEEMNRAFIEALFDRVVLSTREETKMQFSNYLTHLVTSTCSQNAQKCNIEVIMNCIFRYMFSVEYSERRGAEIALRSIIDPLLNQSWSCDKYCFLVTYLAVTSLSTSKASAHVMQVLHIIEKRMELDNSLFHQSSDTRIVPPGFKCTTHSEMLDWLVKRATSVNTLTSKACVRLIVCLSGTGSIDASLYERLESSSSYGLSPDTISRRKGDFRTSIKNQVDCQLWFYVWCLEARMTYDESTEFSANQTMLCAVEWVLKNVSNADPQMLNIYPPTVSEMQGFHELQSFDDMVFAVLKIIMLLQKSLNSEAVSFLGSLTVDMRKIYYKALCHPSQLMIVCNDSKPYNEFSSLLWTFITANDAMTGSFMETLAKDIGRLMHCLGPKTSSPDKAYSRWEKELIDFISRTDWSRLAHRYIVPITEPIKNWIKLLWEYCNSTNISDQIFQNSVLNCTRLFNFMFSLMSPEEASKKVFELLPASQERVYTAFEPIFLNCISRCGDAVSELWFNNIGKQMMELHWILDKFDSSVQGDSFPTAVKGALHTFTTENMGIFRDNVKKQAMFTLLYSLGNSFTSPPGCFAGTAMETLIQSWLREVYSEIYLRLIPFMNPAQCGQWLIARTLFGDERLRGTDVAKSILTTCLFSGHYNLVPWCISNVFSNEPLLRGALGMVLPLFPSFKSTTQEQILYQVYTSALNSELPLYNHFFDVFSHLMESSDVAARKKFYSETWPAVKTCIMDTDLRSGNPKVCNELLKKLSISLVLFTKMYRDFDKTELFGEGGIIPLGVEEAKTLVKNLLSRCYSFQKFERLLTSCHIYQTMWRQFQCFAYNCVIVLVCRAKMVGTMLTHFVFRDIKSGEESMFVKHVLNSIVGGLPSGIYGLITWDEAKRLEDRKKLVETGINNSLQLRNARSHEFYTDVFVTAVSQDSKKFDFVDRQTIRIPEDLATIIAVDEDGDVLDHHACLPYLCSSINKALEGGSTATVANETIPDWLNSFKKLFVNPSLEANAKCLIIKIVHRCQEVLKPFWSFWYMPVLRALPSGCCGKGNTHFYYQVAKMLITWNQPRQTSEFLRLELIAWGDIVKQILESIPEQSDTQHILRLLRWIFTFRKDLELPYGALPPLFNAPNTFESGLDTFIILFENDIIPYSDDSSLENIFRTLDSCQVEETREKRARVIGYLLKTARNPLIKKHYFDQTVHNVKKLSDADKGIFLKELGEMTQAFPQIGEGFIPTILKCLENPKHATLHTSCFAVLDNIVKHSTTLELFNILRDSEFFRILSSNLNASALSRGLQILASFVSLGNADINRYIMTFLKEKIDEIDPNLIALDAMSEMYRLTVTAFWSLGEESVNLPEFRGWIFARFFIEESPQLLDNIVGHVVVFLSRIDSYQEATLMLLEAMASAPFSYHASWCLLSSILLRSYLIYKPESKIVDCRAFAVSKREAVRLLEVPSSSPVECQYGASLATMEEEDLEKAPPADPPMPIRRRSGDCVKPRKLLSTTVTCHEVLLSIRALCIKSRKVINTTFNSVFSGIFSTTLNNDQTARLKNICPIIFEGLLRTHMDDTLPTFLLKLCSDNHIDLPPSLQYNVCQLYELDEVGILMTEAQTLGGPPTFSWDSPSEMVDYYLSLSMYHENLGIKDVSRYIKGLFPDGMLTSEDGPNMTMPKMFSEQQALKAMAALGNWAQLEEDVTRSSSENPSQYALQYNLGFHILSNTNLRISKVTTSDSEMVSSWLDSEKNNKWLFEARFQSEKSMLHFINREMDEFVMTSKKNITNWTYWNALYGKFHPVRHGTTAKKVLDNYAMAVAISEPNGHCSALYDQLASDAPYFPTDPVQWNQIITNREEFLRYAEERRDACYLDIGKHGHHIRYSRVAFMKFLICQGKLSEARSYALRYLKETDWDSSLEASILHLAELKADPLLQRNPQLEIDHFIKNWEIYDQKLANPLGVHIHQHLIEVCAELITCLKSGAEIDTMSILATMGEKLSSKEIISLRNQRMTDIEKFMRCTNHLYAVITRLIATTPASAACMYSDTYYQSAKFNLEHLNALSDISANPYLRREAVKRMLYHLAISSSPDMALFLRAVEVAAEDSGFRMVVEFVDAIAVMQPHQLEPMLPQIMGHYSLDPRTRPFLEPIIEYFIKNCPEVVVVHSIPYFEHDGVQRTIDSLLNRSGRWEGSYPLLNLVDAFSKLCNPKALLKDCLIQMVKAESEEKMIELKKATRVKCMYSRIGGGFTGALYDVNEPYLGSWLDELCQMKLNGVSVDNLVKMIHNKVGNAYLPKGQYDLADFSPFLKQFNFVNAKFPLPTQSGAGSQKTIVKIYHKVLVHKTLREPIEIKVLASDGRDYSLILKLGDNIRQDQIIQQAFSVMNSAIKKRADWDHESVITYNVLPLSSRFGMIEKLEPTISLGRLMRKFEDSNWRSLVLNRHRAWLEGIQEAIPLIRDGVHLRGLPMAAHAASVLHERALGRVMDIRARDVPPNLFSKLLRDYSGSQREYFYKRDNFLRSHAVLSFCHWVLGVGDRNLGNFLLDEKTCRLIGIDFGMAFGEGIEDCPGFQDLAPFRLTPQFQSIYGPLYSTGILKTTMAKCFSSVNDDMEPLMHILKLSSLTGDASSNREEYLEEAKKHHMEIVTILKRKLSLGNPVGIIEHHVRVSAREEHLKEIICELLRNIEVPAEFSSADDVVSALINVASNQALLVTSPTNLEPWI